MPRKPNPVPTYRLHRQSGQAVATVREPDGRRRDVLLGRFNSPESKAEYERLLAALRTSPAAAGRVISPPGVTVNELLLSYLTHAAGYYVGADGRPTHELANMRDALRAVRQLHGHTPAAEFGPLALKAVRQHLVDAGHCRPAINARVNRVRRCFKWAASEELIPAAVCQALATVAGLGKGRTAAPEPPPVRPVDTGTVLATLPRLNRHVATMVRLQLLAGARPGEVCRLCAADLDRSAGVWVYTPARHKTDYRGHVRKVRFGPQAQAVLAPFLAGSAADPAAPLFSPWQAREERYAALRAARRTAVQPSQACRRKTVPTRSPGMVYTVRRYAQAVAAAAKRADVPHWHPSQLRHAFATEVRKKHGLEAAQVLLGHSKADVTQVYAERDDALAERVAAADG